MDEHDLLTVPQGSFDLARLHDGTDSPLRAWDAADSYILEHLDAIDLTGRRIAIVNDAHGALAVALAAHRPISIGDSFVSRLATVGNLERNGRAGSDVTFVSTTEVATESPAPGLDVVIVKVPKTLALLEHELAVVAPRLAPHAVVLGAGMTRHIHTSTLAAFERAIGPTTTSLARRKARLVHATPADLLPSNDSSPASWTRFALPTSGATIVSGPGVFAEGRLDIGTRLLLDHLATRPPADHESAVVDLGCGNGAVGISMLLADPGVRVTFVDESLIAMASARASVQENAGALPAWESRTRFLVGDVLETVAPFAEDSTGHSQGSTASEGSPFEEASAHLVVINPPFHDDHAVGDAIAWRMFTGARAALRPGGEILVVANRHLGYHVKLRRLFGPTDVVASNPKFVVLSARR